MVRGELEGGHGRRGRQRERRGEPAWHLVRERPGGHRPSPHVAGRDVGRGREVRRRSVHGGGPRAGRAAHRREPPAPTDDDATPPPTPRRRRWRRRQRQRQRQRERQGADRIEPETSAHATGCRSPPRPSPTWSAVFARTTSRTAPRRDRAGPCSTAAASWQPAGGSARIDDAAGRPRHPAPTRSSGSRPAPRASPRRRCCSSATAGCSTSTRRRARSCRSSQPAVPGGLDAPDLRAHADDDVGRPADRRPVGRSRGVDDARGVPSHARPAASAASPCPGTAFEYSNLGYARARPGDRGRRPSVVHGVRRARAHRAARPRGSLRGTRWRRARGRDGVPSHARRLGRAAVHRPGRLLGDRRRLRLGPEPRGMGRLAGRGVARRRAGPAVGGEPAGAPAAAPRRRRRAAWLPRTTTCRPPSMHGYGYGLVVEHHPRFGPIVSHSGGYPGFSAHMRWHAASGLGVVALENATYAKVSRGRRDSRSSGCCEDADAVSPVRPRSAAVARDGRRRPTASAGSPSSGRMPRPTRCSPRTSPSTCRTPSAARRSRPAWAAVGGRNAAERARRPTRSAIRPTTSSGSCRGRGSARLEVRLTPLGARACADLHRSRAPGRTERRVPDRRSAGSEVDRVARLEREVLAAALLGRPAEACVRQRLAGPREQHLVGRERAPAARPR